MSRDERFKRLLPYFSGSVFMAVFNSYEYDRQKARKQIIEHFGREAYDRDVKPVIRTGVMALFRHDPTRILRHYALRVALAAERRHGKGCA